MPRQSTATRVKQKPLKKAWQADLDDYVNDLCFAPDGDRIVAAAASGRITVLDRHTGEIMSTWLAHKLGALVARWSYDGSLLATAGQDGSAYILHGNTLERIAKLEHGCDWVEHIAWAPKDNFILTGAGKALRLWNGGGVLIREFAKHSSTIAGVQWNPTARDIFATSCYGGVRLWRTGTIEPKRHLKWKGSLLNLEYSPNGKVIACGCQDGAVHFWVLPNGDDLEMSGYPTKVRELAWDHQSRFLATGGSEQPVVWDFSGKGPEGSKPVMLNGHENFVSFLSYQPRGKLLASAGFDGRIFLWDPSMQKLPLASTSLDSEVSKLSWSPDGTTLISGLASGAVDCWMPFVE